MPVPCWPSTTPEAQTAALRTVLLKELNVRQTEELVRRLSGEKPSRKTDTCCGTRSG